MKVVKFKPLNGRVLVEEILEDDKTAGGVIKSTQDAATTGKGIIVAITYPQEVLDSDYQNENKAYMGDEVAYNKKAGGLIQLKEGEFRQLPYLDLYGVI